MLPTDTGVLSNELDTIFEDDGEEGSALLVAPADSR
jgi:hypothetical protein